MGSLVDELGRKKKIFPPYGLKERSEESMEKQKALYEAKMVKHHDSRTLTLKTHNDIFIQE